MSDRVELAHEPDFVLGRLTVSPSRRELVRDDGAREVIEHRVMQVLVALSKAEGGIVTRDELIMLCWDGRVVGEDSIHRVISHLRKIANGIGAGSIEIETITKIGYRLTSADMARVVGVQAPQGPLAEPGEPRSEGKRKVPALAAVAIPIVAAGLLAWTYAGRNALPVVAVQPADSSGQSRILSRDLFVKLGTLSEVGSGQWRLVEAASARSKPTLLFRAAAFSSNSEAHSNLTLLDGEDESVLWSREFKLPAGRENDLRQHVSLTAGRVLGCALEARQHGGLPSDLERLFLTGCAAMAETSDKDPQIAAGIMREIVRRRPRFAPAWARLLLDESAAFDRAHADDKVAANRAALLRDIAGARKVAPELPEIKLAQLRLLSRTSYAEAFQLLDELKAQAPDEAEVWVEDANALARVGRLRDSIVSARRAVELDPLSPATSREFIKTLASAGEIEAARRELARAERLWPGTGSLRDAQFAFHLRYGDPRIARALIEAGYSGRWADPYLKARLDPSAANVDRLLRTLKPYRPLGTYGRAALVAFGVQDHAEFHRTDELFDWIRQFPPDAIASSAYVLFRPGSAEVRRDPRFMRVARRIGLVEHWEKSGHWPDFCADPGLPYDCRKEAARLAS